jgi:hypothetical protein
MERLKKKKTIREDSPKSSQSDWISGSSMTQKEMEDYLRWYEERKSKG